MPLTAQTIAGAFAELRAHTIDPQTNRPISQVKFAARLGITPSNASRIENPEINQRPSDDLLRQVAAEFPHLTTFEELVRLRAQSPPPNRTPKSVRQGVAGRVPASSSDPSTASRLRPGAPSPSSRPAGAEPAGAAKAHDGPTVGAGAGRGGLSARQPSVASAQSSGARRAEPVPQPQAGPHVATTGRSPRPHGPVIPRGVGTPASVSAAAADAVLAAPSASSVTPQPPAPEPFHGRSATPAEDRERQVSGTAVATDGRAADAAPQLAVRRAQVSVAHGPLPASLVAAHLETIHTFAQALALPVGNGLATDRSVSRSTRFVIAATLALGELERLAGTQVLSTESEAAATMLLTHLWQLSGPQRAHRIVANETERERLEAILVHAEDRRTAYQRLTNEMAGILFPDGPTPEEAEDLRVLILRTLTLGARS